MLYYIIQQLTEISSAFNALTYLSSRGILALITAIFVSMILYPPAIRWLRAIKAGQPIRTLGPETHFTKSGTPTMGGLVILFATLMSAFLWMDLSNHHLWSLTFVTISFGLVGFGDDYLKVIKRNHNGLASRYKFLALLGFGLIAITWHTWASTHLGSPVAPFEDVTLLRLPFFKQIALEMGWFYLPFAVIVLVGTSNAVNLTDGLDGLVIGPVLTCSIALLVLSYVTGNVRVAEYLYYYTVPGTGEIVVFLSGLIGASIGFLWFNTWPAQVFMGDSGALPLGGIIGMVAVITGHEILLVIMGGIFVVEALSVIMQVTSFKLTGKRIFRMAPLHHHYEKIGWPEQKITVRCWIISLVLALISILTLKLR